MCSLQRNYEVIRNWERFETGPLTVMISPWILVSEFELNLQC